MPGSSFAPSSALPGTSTATPSAPQDLSQQDSQEMFGPLDDDYEELFLGNVSVVEAPTTATTPTTTTTTTATTSSEQLLGLPGMPRRPENQPSRRGTTASRAPGTLADPAPPPIQTDPARANCFKAAIEAEQEKEEAAKAWKKAEEVRMRAEEIRLQKLKVELEEAKNRRRITLCSSWRGKMKDFWPKNSSVDLN